MKYQYQSTLYACYAGYITQAIVNNLAPLLFVIFQSSFSLSFEEVGRLILVNFGTQILADLLAVKYVDKIGYRKAAALAHLFCAVGLIGLALLPHLISPYLGLTIAVVIYALGGGLLEVLVSPIVEALPGDQKESAMSLLHSFYCWGQMAVVLLSTLFLWIFGTHIWWILPIVWAVLPIWNLFRFLKVPLVSPVPEQKLMSLKELLSNRFFLLALVLMMCAGASELTMSQWSSLFAETGLHVPKVVGDLLGPCLFAVFMGIGRTWYGLWGERIHLKKAMLFTGGLCVCCYFITVFSPIPILSLLGCAVCGFSVSLMWPGTFSMTAARFPMGGTAMFGMLAVFGDLGASIGPWFAGVFSDLVQNSKPLEQFSLQHGIELSELGLKCGLLAAILFPLILVVGVLFFQKNNKQTNCQNPDSQ